MAFALPLLSVWIELKLDSWTVFEVNRVFVRVDRYDEQARCFRGTFSWGSGFNGGGRSESRYLNYIPPWYNTIQYNIIMLIYEIYCNVIYAYLCLGSQINSALYMLISVKAIFWMTSHDFLKATTARPSVHEKWQN